MGEPVSLSELARIMHVPKSRVSMWVARREKNGFPWPVDVGSIAQPLTGKRTGGPRTGSRYDPDECVAWYRDYVPARGGRLPGTQNDRPRDAAGRFL